MYFIKTPKIIRFFFKDYLWSIKTNDKEIYLTFDDGPTPVVTEFVLDTLKKYQAKATFFCIGKNIDNHPKIFQRILNEGHSVGNHTQNHLNGWKTKTLSYIENVKKCQNSLDNVQDYKREKLFRPPYGKIAMNQAKKIIKQGYRIIMWSVLSGDFDLKITKEQCLNNVLKNTKKGDIVVFHDSKKAYTNIEYTLPKVLDYFVKQAFVFKKL